MSDKRIYLPSISLTQPPLPPHVSALNALQSRLLLAWGRLRGADRERVVVEVERLGAQP